MLCKSIRVFYVDSMSIVACSPGLSERECQNSMLLYAALPDPLDATAERERER